MKYSVWNTLRCECHKCDSYPGVTAELRQRCMPGVYCAKGESCVEVVKNGCYCPNCGVYRSNGLKEEYYCITGKARILYNDKKEKALVTHEEKARVGVSAQEPTPGAAKAAKGKNSP